MRGAARESRIRRLSAVANLPLYVDAPVKVPMAQTTVLPFVVYNDGGRDKPPYVPTGWMGNAKAMPLSQLLILPAGGTNLCCAGSLLFVWRAETVGVACRELEPATRYPNQFAHGRFLSGGTSFSRNLINPAASASNEFSP